MVPYLLATNEVAIGQQKQLKKQIKLETLDNITDENKAVN